MTEENAEEKIGDGKEKIQEGAQKLMKGGLEKGREKRERLRYYRRNRSEILEDFGINKQKAPAAEGLIVLLPMVIVGVVIAWLFDKIELIPYNGLLNLTNYYVLNQSIKLAALLTAGTLLAAFTGKVVRTESGFKVEKMIDKAIGRIPFLGGIYRITKVTTETIIDGPEELSKPVKLEIGDIKMTAFKTGNRTEDGREILFLPTAPNITSGLILEVKPEEIIETDESAEKALTRTLSAGFGQSQN